MNIECLDYLEQVMYKKCSIDNTTCYHEEILNDDGKEMCLSCGQMFTEKFIFITNTCIRNKNKNICSIYNEIPVHISSNIKNLTIEIYQAITENRIFRNSSKKSIILACLHQASALLNDSKSYCELLQMFQLKQHEANKGFVLLYTKLPRFPEYMCSTFKNEEDSCIKSLLKIMSLFDETLYTLVLNTFRLVKLESFIINKSQPFSIINGCIFFWVLFTKRLSYCDIVAKLRISKMTLNKVYTPICNVVYNLVMKDFVQMLFVCCSIKCNKLFNKQHDLYIHNPTTDMVVVKNDAVIDLQTDEMLEWNIFLDTCYYDNDEAYPLDIKLLKVNKIPTFDFSCFDKTFHLSGDEMFYTLLTTKIKNLNLS